MTHALPMRQEEWSSEKQKSFLHFSERLLSYFLGDSVSCEGTEEKERFFSLKALLLCDENIEASVIEEVFSRYFKEFRYFLIKLERVHPRTELEKMEKLLEEVNPDVILMVGSFKTSLKPYRKVDRWVRFFSKKSLPLKRKIFYQESLMESCLLNTVTKKVTFT